MTIEELSKLTDEELRLECASLCGWRKMTKEEFKIHGVDWINDLRHEVASHYDLPMYPQNLNAMHEAEGLMNEDQCKEFNLVLMDTKPARREIKKVSERWTWGSTARQRCIAFIAVMQSD